MSASLPVPSAHPDRRQLLLATAITFAALAAIGLWTQSRMGGQLLPHAFCISASEPLLLLHLASDGLIAFAYLAIPWAILNFVNQRADIPFGWIAWVFGAFIVACGFTHALEIVTLWYPVYWYAGVAKAFTAAVSLGTAWLLYRLTPVFLALPSADDLRVANETLRAEVRARQQAEKELAQAHAQLEALLGKVQGEARITTAVLDRFFDQSPIGLALVGGDGRVQRINPALRELTGRSVDDYAGTPVPSLAAVDPGVVKAIEEVRQGAQRRSVVSVLGRGANERVLDCTLFAIPVDGSERLVGGVVVDNTAEHHLARERAQAIDSLRTADQRKDEFIAVLAHELRNPLAPIGNTAFLLCRSTDAKVKKMGEVVTRQVDHMRRLLDDLLDVSRIVQHKVRVDLEPLDLVDLVRQVAEDLRPTLERAGNSLTIETDDALPVEADATRITQAVGNYLHNACKFAVGAPVRVRAYAEGNEAVVRVEDGGPGIAPDLAGRLFEPFAQGSQELARQTGGLGLGLALAKGIAELHGGRVAAGNAGVKGAVFELRLPLQSEVTA